MSSEGLKSERSPKTDVTSSEYYIGLRDSLIESTGIKNEYELGDAVRKVCEELSQLRTIDTESGKRHQSILARLKGIKGSDHRENDDRFIEKWAGDYSNASLDAWREKLRISIEAFEEQGPELDILESIEFDPLVQELLERHDKERVAELLKPDVPLTPEELKDVSTKIHETIEFRNRKIGEFLAYRFARKASSDIPIEEFLNEAHGIVQEKKERDLGYRHLDMSGPMTVLFPTWAIPQAMRELGDRIEREQVSTDKAHVQMQALKYYLLFELIHPFSDGNGRTGRALFVHLQKRFSEGHTDGRPIHIPIARFESGTIHQDSVGTKFVGRLGSLSLDIGTLVDQILKDPAVVRLGSVSFSNHMRSLRESGKEVTPEETSQLIQESIDAVSTILDSEEVEGKLRQMISVMEVQSARDVEQNEDWKIVADGMKNELRARRRKVVPPPVELGP